MIQVRIPESVYVVVGDSASQRFDGLIVEHPLGAATMKARWQPVSRMEDVFTGGKISEYLTRILIEMRWVKRTTRTQWPFPCVAERIDGSGPAFNLEPRDADRCVLLFSYGDGDMFTLAHEYAAFGPGGALQAVQSRCEPLFNAIRTLQGVGYRNVFLHDLLPPAKTGPPQWPRYEVRFELVSIARRLFREFATSAGIGFVSIWDEVFSEEKGRLPQYVRDHAHLNQASAVLSARYLCEELERRGFYREQASSAAADRLLSLVAQVMRVDAAELCEDSTFEDFKTWDSNSEVELAMMLEFEYGINLGNEEMERLRSVRDVRGILAAHAHTAAPET